jgi:hypothetical protein
VSKLTAYANLGYHAVRTLARRTFGERRGLSAFLLDYHDDRLPPLTAEERKLLGSFDGCLSCGLCDTLARPSERDDRGGLPGPSALPASVSRHPPDYDGLGAYLARLDGEDLARMERMCPARVPFRRLMQMVRDAVERESLIPGSSEAAP